MSKKNLLTLVFPGLFFLTACSSISNPSPYSTSQTDSYGDSFYKEPATKPTTKSNQVEPLASEGSSNYPTTQGTASWYGPGFHGKMTASGEAFDQNSLTVAHKTLPFGTKLRITNLENNRSILATVNDRGPFIPGRILDGSKRVAEELDYIGTGTAEVKVEVLSVPDSKTARKGFWETIQPNSDKPALEKPALSKDTTPPKAEIQSNKESLGEKKSPSSFSDVWKGAPPISAAKTENSTTRIQPATGGRLAGEKFIQIGAFSTSERAVNYGNEMGRKLAVSNIFSERTDRGLYRVLIGPVSKVETREITAKLDRQDVPYILKGD